MRDKQSKKGGGLMIVHKNNQAHTELEQFDTKQEDFLILRGTLQSMNVTIILIYFSVIRSNQIKNYLFTHTNKFIVYIRAKCSKVFTYIQTQLL